MYLQYWGFKEKPFENTPDPRFFYSAPRHEEALARLLYAVSEHKGAAMLSGEYGSGKTLLTRVISSRLLTEADKYNVAIIINPNISSDELLSEILYQLGKKPQGQYRKGESIRELNTLLYDTACRGRHTVIIIDEAQAIEDEKTFEELRLLLNFQLNDRFLLTLLLFGQPELREKVSALKQLEQRLAIRYHLTPFTPEETAAYLKHRCTVAGRDDGMFSQEACYRVYQGSGGTPRLINTISDLALVSGLGRQVNRLDAEIISEVINDLKG